MEQHFWTTVVAVVEDRPPWCSRVWWAARSGQGTIFTFAGFVAASKIPPNNSAAVHNNWGKLFRFSVQNTCNCHRKDFLGLDTEHDDLFLWNLCFGLRANVWFYKQERGLSLKYRFKPVSKASTAPLPYWIHGGLPGPSASATPFLREICRGGARSRGRWGL